MKKRLHPFWYAVMLVMAVAVIDVLRFALASDGGVNLLATQVRNAVTLGGIYALIAVGYTLIYGIVKLINFAHGEIYMLGAFFGILLIAEGVSFFPALLLSMLGCAIVSMTMDQIAYRPLRQQFRTSILVPLVLLLIAAIAWPAVMFAQGNMNFAVALAIVLPVCVVFVFAAERFAFLPMTKESPRLAALITAIGMSLFLQNAAMLVFGAAVRPFPELDQDRHITIGVDPSANRNAAPDGLGSRLPADALQTLQAELGAALAAAQDERAAEVPFFYSYHLQQKSLVSAREMGLDGLEERAAEVQATLRSMADLEAHAVHEKEGRLVVDLEFSRGTSDQASQVFRRDLKAWLKNPTREQKPSVRSPGLGLAIGHELLFSDEKSEHPFQMDLLASLVGPREEGGQPTVSLPLKTLFIWVSVLLILIGMNTLVHHTRFGAAMRACALDKDAASLMGVNVNRVILITFALSGAMAAVAGVLYGLYLGSSIFYRMGYYAGVMAFFAAVLGGIGNLKGAVLGGMILGFVQAISEAYVTDWVTDWIRWIAQKTHDIMPGFAEWIGLNAADYTFNTSYSYAIACVILITVILIRPTGILGSLEADRA